MAEALRRVGRRRETTACYISWLSPLGRKTRRVYRRGPRVTVAGKILARKFALPNVGHITAIWLELIAACKFSLIKTAACGILPLGFGRQLLAGPDAEAFGTAIRNMHYM